MKIFIKLTSGSLHRQNELCFSRKQCCGSRSKWIRVDFGPPGSWSGSVFVMRIQIQEQGNGPKLTNKPDFQPLKKALYLRRYVLLSIIYIKYLYFSCKKFNILWQQNLTRIRIRIKTNADSQHCKKGMQWTAKLMQCIEQFSWCYRVP